MKLLMFQAPRFHFRPFIKTAAEMEDQECEQELREVAVIFIHVEAQDELCRAKVLTKTLKNIKWLANKRKLRNIALHSFNHLSESKADMEFARCLLEDLAARLHSSDYQVWLTPFGYSCEWDLSVYGESLAKVFKAI